MTSKSQLQAAAAKLDALKRQHAEKKRAGAMTGAAVTAETEHTKGAVLAFLQQLAHHRMMCAPGESMRLVFEAVDYVAVRTMADLHITKLLETQPGLAPLVESVGKLIRNSTRMVAAGEEPRPTDPAPAMPGGQPVQPEQSHAQPAP